VELKQGGGDDFNRSKRPLDYGSNRMAPPPPHQPPYFASAAPPPVSGGYRENRSMGPGAGGVRGGDRDMDYDPMNKRFRGVDGGDTADRSSHYGPPPMPPMGRNDGPPPMYGMPRQDEVRNMH
jgi:hypothetical protein